MSDIPVWIGAGGPWALVSLFAVLIYTGRLVPRSVHEDAVKAKTEEAATWKQAHSEERQLRRHAVESLDRLADGQEVLVKALEAGLSAAQLRQEDEQ